MKWDTLSATVRSRGMVLIAELRDAKQSRTWLAIGEGHHLLWLHQSGHNMERRPLEGTVRYGDFARIRGLIGDLK